MAEEKDFCQEILRVILDDEKLVVVDSQPQWTGTNLKGRSVILDAKCVLGNSEVVNIEVQKADKDDHQRRVRYNGAVLTTNITPKGSFYKDVPNVIVVYIALFDIFHLGCPVYHVDRTLRESGDVVFNGFREVYVNSKARDGSAVAELMKVFTEDDAYSDRFPVTSNEKRRYKETEEGRIEMSEITKKLYDDARQEGRQEGLQEGRQKGRQEGYGMLYKLIKKGVLTPAVAAESIGIAEEELMERLQALA